jgi:hypothetical protein
MGIEILSASNQLEPNPTSELISPLRWPSDVKALDPQAGDVPEKNF